MSAPQPAVQTTPTTTITLEMRVMALTQSTTTHSRALLPAVSTYIFTCHSPIALKLCCQQLAVVVMQAFHVPAYTQPQSKTCNKPSPIHVLAFPSLFPATCMATSSQVI